MRQTVVAAVIAAVVVCALLAGLVGSVLQDAAAPPGPTEGTGPLPNAQPSEYEAEMRTAIAANPADAVALTSLANLLTLDGRLPESLDLYGRAVAADPANIDTRRAFGIALAQAGNLADAELQFQDVLDRRPDDVDTLYFLGQLYERWSPPRLVAAADAYRRAVAAAPGSVAADQAAKALARLPAATPEGRAGATPAAS